MRRPRGDGRGGGDRGGKEPAARARESGDRAAGEIGAGRHRRATGGRLDRDGQVRRRAGTPAAEEVEVDAHELPRRSGYERLTGPACAVEPEAAVRDGEVLLVGVV